MQSISSHKSLGTKITEERLNVYEKLTQKNISFEYIDLYEDNIPQGTEMLIRREDNV